LFYIAHRSDSLEPLNLPAPRPKENEVVVKIHTASLNHRDLFIRQHLYPGTAFGVPLLADGYGTVTSGPSNLLNKPVILSPGRGWLSDPLGPEGNYAIMGGTIFYPTGTLQEFLTIPADEVELAPEHLSPEEAAALPLCGLTAWRAVMTKGQVSEGQNVLITGIGGGVALMALLFCVAKGAKVYVTSSSSEKLEKAKKLGAVGGVSYKSSSWDKELAGVLPKDRPYLDSVIDGAGGDIVARSMKILKPGGKIVSYGMTTGPKIDLGMGAVMRNIDVLGSTMGSRREFKDMIEFVREKKVRPVVSKVVDGIEIEKVEELFDEMKKGGQFGKLVVKVSGEGAKL
jgi:NADPH:quinone reductase-like Zn-dependent oxidoreductase